MTESGTESSGIVSPHQPERPHDVRRTEDALNGEGVVRKEQIIS